MKTSELIGPALDWAVAKCEGHNALIDVYGCIINRGDTVDRFEPSTNWAHGGPIIEKEGINSYKGMEHSNAPWWFAYKFGKRGEEHMLPGQTPLIAAMRCYVASKLGDEVEVPEELR